MKIKIRTLIIAAALFAFTPALASAQNYEYMGREGKAMAAGEMFWKWLKGDDKKDEKPVVKSSSAKKKASSAGKAQASQSAPYYLMGREGKMMALGEALQRKKNEADTKNNNGRKSEKQIIAEELAAIPAAVKNKYDSMAKSKAFGALVAEVKSFKPSASKNYYAEKYYILQAVVKVNGKGLASVGSLQVANAILTTTDKNSYSYKEAAKVKKAIENSGKAL